MTIHRVVTPVGELPARTAPGGKLIGEIALAPVSPGGWSPRRRLAVIGIASAWLWTGIATIGYYALR